jgi:hypothetical protein
MDDCTRKYITDSALNISHGKEKYNGILEEIINWAELLMGVVLVSAVAFEFHWIYMVAPPLIVAFVELSKPKGSLQDKAGLVFALLALAAFLGVFWLFLIHYFLQWPVWISTGLTTVSVFFLFNILQLPFPPAAAISLLPTIIPFKSIWIYPWQVLLGSASFIIVSLVLFKNIKLQQNSQTNNYRSK